MNLIASAGRKTLGCSLAVALLCWPDALIAEPPHWSSPNDFVGNNYRPFAGGGDPSPLNDAFGDAQDTFGAGGPLLDLDLLHVQFDDTTLDFSMIFFNEIAAPSENLPESAYGLIEFDTDQNNATGVPPLQNTFDPPFTSLDIGVDYFLDLGSEANHPGEVDLISVNDGPVGTIPVSFGPTVIAGEIPLTWLNDDGLLHFSSIVGTLPQPTDAFETFGISIPEPATSLLLLAAAPLLVRRRR